MERRKKIIVNGQWTITSSKEKVQRKKFKGKRGSGDLAKVESTVDADLRKVSMEPVRALHRTGAKNAEDLNGVDNGGREENYR